MMMTIVAIVCHDSYDLYYIPFITVYESNGYITVT